MGCLVCTLLGKSGIEDEIESDEHRREIIEELRNDLEQYHPKEKSIPESIVADKFKRVVLNALRNLCLNLGYPISCVEVAENFSDSELDNFLGMYKNYLNK